MQFHVTFRLFNQIIDRPTLLGIREAVGKQMREIGSQDKLIAGGMFADWRGGYMILEASTGGELINLLGEAIIDHFEVDSHPLFTFEELGEFFQKHGGA